MYMICIPLDHTEHIEKSCMENLQNYALQILISSEI